MNVCKALAYALIVTGAGLGLFAMFTTSEPAGIAAALCGVVCVAVGGTMRALKI